MAWTRLALPRQALEQPRLGLRSDSRDVAQAACRGSLAQLVGRPDAQCARELDRALRAVDADHGESQPYSREDHEHRHEKTLTGERLHPDRVHGTHIGDRNVGVELGHRRRSRPDRLSRTPVRPRGIRIRVGELEQRRERLEPLGDLLVAHRAVVSRAAPLAPPRAV